MQNTISWCVYDCTADEMIGTWNDYQDALQFQLDNETSSDCWGIFPDMEVTLPVK